MKGKGVKPRGLSPAETVKLYDAWGARQDGAGYYEDAAVAEVARFADFERARAVVEFGCGTGRFAEALLANRLPSGATYWGCDVSETMSRLSRERLSRFGARATVWTSAGEAALPLAAGCADRFVSNYVLDILSQAEIRAVIGEAARVLTPDGLLCLTGLTHGKGAVSKLWTAFWNLRFDLNPKWVGGCRPVALLEFLGAWEVVHHAVVVARGISSEVVVARKR